MKKNICTTETIKFEALKLILDHFVGVILGAPLIHMEMHFNVGFNHKKLALYKPIKFEVLKL